MNDRPENTDSTDAGDGRAARKGRYRKVEVRTWGDEKFRALSPMPPCGQGLWLFLITGPHTNSIPGLFRAGRAAMAEELGWGLEAFDQAFAEAFAQGMVQADFSARLVWIPKAINHNRPESLNVVKSWGAEFDLLPECDLKREAFESLKASIHALSEAYAKAFDEAFTKPSGKPSAKPRAIQEQKQVQLKEIPPNPPQGGEGADSATPSPPKTRRRRDAVLTSEGMERFDQVWKAYPRKVGKKQAMGEWFKLNPSEELVEQMLVAIKAQGLAEVKRERGERFVPHLSTWLHGERWNDEMQGAHSQFNGADIIGSAHGRDPLGNGVSL